MSNISFKDAGVLNNTTSLNLSKNKIQESCAEFALRLDLLNKLHAVKRAIEESSIENTILNIHKIKDIDDTLEISREEFTDKTLAQQVDIYRTNVLEKLDQNINKHIDEQSDLMGGIEESVTALKELVNEFTTQLEDKQPITSNKLDNAIGDDLTTGYKIISAKDYADVTLTFMNRFNYARSFFHPSGYLYDFDAEEFTKGMPFYQEGMFHEDDQTYFPRDLNIKKSKFSTMDWNGRRLMLAYEQLEKVVPKHADVITSATSAIRKIMMAQKKTATIKQTQICYAMYNLVDSYAKATRAFMHMFYNLLDN